MFIFLCCFGFGFCCCCFDGCFGLVLFCFLLVSLLFLFFILRFVFKFADPCFACLSMMSLSSDFVVVVVYIQLLYLSGSEFLLYLFFIYNFYLFADILILFIYCFPDFLYVFVHSFHPALRVRTVVLNSLSPKSYAHVSSGIVSGDFVPLSVLGFPLSLNV